MPSVSVRVALAALAGVPVAGVGFLGASGAFGDAWALPAVYVAGGVSVFAVGLTTRMVFDHLRKANGAYRLMHPSAQRAFAQDLPTLKQQRARIDALLSEPATALTPFPDEPETLEAALRRTLLHIFVAWGIEDRAALSDEDIVELSLLLMMIEGDPGDAGRIANACLRPDQMLDLRDELTAIGKRRKRFETQRDTFEATRAIWHMRRNRQVALRDSLERMALPDIDLWHHVALEHDPTDLNQRDAAVWCVQQSACDKATVAVWLSRVLCEGHAERAAAQGDLGFVWAIEKVISLWNSGWYRTRELALEPPETIAAQKEAMNDALDRLAKQINAQRWPTPHGVYDLYEGRPVQRRDNWCLVTGTLTTPPRFEDYVEGAA